MAAELLSGFGQSVTITRRSAGTYSPSTGAATITSTTQTAKAVILPMGRKAKQGDSNIPADTRQCLLAALNTSGTALTAPKVDDYLTDAAGLKYAVTAVEPLTPAGLDIIYDLAVRVQQ
jgi:hypothetical protein